MDIDRIERNLSFDICRRVKEIYYFDEAWSESYKPVSMKYNSLIKNMNTFYPRVDSIEAMKSVLRLNSHDLKEMVEFIPECST